MTFSTLTELVGVFDLTRQADRASKLAEGIRRQPVSGEGARGSEGSAGAGG